MTVVYRRNQQNVLSLFGQGARAAAVCEAAGP